MNIEVLKALEEIKQMVIEGDEKVKKELKELKEYIKDQSKTKKVKSTKKDGD